MKLFVVGEYLGYFKGVLWRYKRTFDNKEDAIKECIDEKYFIIPIEVDLQEALEKINFEKNIYYPKGENNMELFVVGRYISGEKFNIVWDFQGVFDSEDKALEECGDEEACFIGPVKLNKGLPKETIDWPGAYYPNQKEETNKE